MSQPSPSCVFISYARKDGADLAWRLRSDLAGSGFRPWLDTREIAGGDSWTDDVERGIDGSDAVLALLTPGSYASRICRAEQLRALRKDKLVIPLLAKTSSDIPLHLEPANYRDFTGSLPYEKQFQILLEDLGRGRGGASLKAEYRSTYVTAPPLPLNFVPRPDEQQSLRQFVMANSDGIGVALTALEGMGGIGKTILAQSICHDEAIQQAFPDGVLWVTAGQEPVHSLRDRINEVRGALNNTPGPAESELSCINRYRALLGDKAVLLVVDDVWRIADIEPFLVESARSCVLFTTRDTKIAASLGARECSADLLSPEKSRELLARYSGVALGELPRESGLLIEQCGRLPLALAMVGAMLRGKPPAFWQHVLTLLRSADLRKIKAQFPNYRHDDLLKCIQVSVNGLEAEQRERYLALAVLLEDMAAVPAIQQALWNADPGEAMDTAEQFIALSLAQREGEGIRLHDLQLDYVRAQFADREALDLIHGAMRLSAHVIARDPDQFASQMVGRLLPHHDLAAIKLFAENTAQGAQKPWLRPLQATLHPPGTSLVRTLYGHTGVVNSVVLSEDGRRAVSASSDRTLKVWDVETGHELRTLQGHASSVLGVAVSGDGRRAVSASDDQTLKVWDVETGRELRTLQGHAGAVTDVALGGEGRRAVSASSDHTLRVWDLETGRELGTLKGHTNRVNAVALAGNGRRAVSASSDHTLRVWDLETGRELGTLKGHTNRVNGVALSRDGKHAVSASSDDTLKVWDVETGRELGTLHAHTSRVNGVTLIGDGKRAISASADRTLKVWDVETGRELRTLQGHASSVLGVAVSGDGQRAVSASWDRTLKVWDVEMLRELHIPHSHANWVLGVAVSGDGQRALSGSYDQTLKVWDVETGRELRTLQGHTDRVNGVALSMDGRRAVSASYDHTLKVWDVETGRELRTLQGHTSRVNGVTLSGDGRRALSASWDNTLKVWDVETGRQLLTLQGHAGVVNGAALSGDGRRAVSASSDHTLKVWDVETGGQLCTLYGHTNWVNGVALSEDMRRAVSASADHTLKVWDMETASECRTLHGHTALVNRVALSRDGRRAVSASWDHTVKVWDVETGVAIATFTCDGAGYCCAFITNDQFIAGDAGGRVHFLRLEEPKSRK